MKAVLAVVLTTVLAGASLAPFAAEAGESPKIPRLEVISDAPNASPLFVEFFFRFDGLLIAWWQRDGHTMISKRWQVVARERVASSFRGIEVTVRSMPSGHVVSRNRYEPMTPRLMPASAELAAAAVIELMLLEQSRQAQPDERKER